jgi:tetratricopeptide (TPR) repeat protein
MCYLLQIERQTKHQEIMIINQLQKSLPAFIMLLTMSVCFGQGPVTTPPSGGNQKASVTQHMGLVEVTVDYSSPDVTGPNGESRKGAIWGQLVPYGMNNLGFGTAKESPWRAGANENTVFTTSHDILVEGKPLAAGSYGLHMITNEGNWTIIFNNSSTAWGSYFYEPSEDALRVEVAPVENEFTEWLTYGFEDRQLASSTLYLKWENLKVPVKLSCDINEVYLTKIRQELESSKGFSWQGWQSAANFCLQNDVNLEEGLDWAERSITAPFGIGVENFVTLDTKAQLLEKLGRAEEAATVMSKAIDHPTATMQQIHFYARRLIAAGKNQEALKVFELNRKRNPDDEFTTIVGLARGYEAVGKNKKAIENYRLAAKNAPPGQQSYYENLAKQLEQDS